VEEFGLNILPSFYITMLDEDGTLRYERYNGQHLSYRAIRLFYRRYYNANRNVKKD
jgi:hypothetical protein